MSRQGIKQPPHSAGRRLVGMKYSTIDPNLIPAVPEVAAADQAIWSSEPFLTCDTRRTVPLSTSTFNAVDQGQCGRLLDSSRETRNDTVLSKGNSSPRFIRATTYAFPQSQDLASSCEIPLAAILQPFADQRPEEIPVPIVDFGPHGPPRCANCRAYVNPWTVWTMSGQRWVCNLCGTESTGEPSCFRRSINRVTVASVLFSSCRLLLSAGS